MTETGKIVINEYCLLFCYNDKKLYYIDRE